MSHIVIVYSTSADEPIDVSGRTRPKTERMDRYLKPNHKQAVEFGRAERQRLSREENRNAWIQIRGPRGGVYWL